MKKTAQWSVLASCVVLLLAGCTGKEATPQGNAKPVKISKNASPSGKPSVSPDPVEIYISKGEEVEWDAGGQEFVVSFGPNSPFGNSYFHEGRRRSGLPKKTGTFKYSVMIGGQELDPTVIIKD